MKLRLKTGIIGLLSLLFSFSAVHAETTYIVSGNPYAPPVVWEEHQQLVGLAPDIAATVFKELGLTYTVKRFGDWKSVQDKTRAGQVDMIVSAYSNEERQQYLDFSVPYLAQPTVIVVEKGKEFAYTGWESLKGKKGVSSIGESYGTKFDTFIKEHLDVRYYQFERAIQDLNLGEVDYLIVDLYTALIYARLLQGEDSITILDPPVTVQDFRLAVRKDSPLAAHLPDIDRVLVRMIKDETVANLLMSHFDRWKRLIDRRAGFLDADKKARSSQQQEYLKEQDEFARQRLLKTMVDREGLPEAAQ